jgi:hypothetical protein
MLKSDGLVLAFVHRKRLRAITSVKKEGSQGDRERGR